MERSFEPLAWGLAALEEALRLEALISRNAIDYSMIMMITVLFWFDNNMVSIGYSVIRARLHYD